MSRDHTARASYWMPPLANDGRLARIPDRRAAISATHMSDTNLSLQLTNFIGHEAELAGVKQLLRSSGATRLVTLTGAGGIGKTRFALEVASDLLEAFNNGVWLIELAGLSAPAQVTQVVAETFDLREAPRRPVISTLTAFLGSKRLLLVLDNCEHLIEACARLAETLLRACPNLKILATSRETLGVFGETVWPVAPLTVPDFWRWPAAGSDVGAALLQYEAVRLFVERAGHYARGFVVTNQNAVAIGQICLGLDGLPLAIELAAARIQTMAVEQIAARLADHDRFHLLTQGSRTAAPRHQTLRAVIDWSYELLTSQEQWVFRQLAVFANGWTLEAAEWICADDSDSALAPAEVFNLLAHLVSKSLVNAGERDGQTRYWLLETIREYAAAKLAHLDEAQRAGQRHLEFFVKLAEETEPKLILAEQQTAATRLEAEHDNARAAWAWALEHDAARAVRLAWSLRLFWYRRGHLTEAHEWSTQLLQRVEADVPTVAGALTFNLAGTVANWQFDHARARSYFEQGLAMARALGNKRQVAVALQGIGVTGLGLGQSATARHYLEQSLPLFQELNDQWRIANVLGGLSVVVADQGDYLLASKLGAESLARYRQLGDRLGTAQPLLNLGELARAQADYTTAADYFQQCLDLGSTGNQGGALHNLGQLVLRAGNYPRAKELLQASLAFYREQNNLVVVVSCLAGLAGVIAAGGKALPAARLFGAVAARWEDLGAAMHAADRADYDRNLALVRAGLDEESFAKAWASGQTLSLDQAIELALTEAVTVGQEIQAPRSGEVVKAQPDLIIVALGRACVWRDGRELVSTDWRYAKAKELLFFLLCQPPQTKEQIGLALWPEASPDQLRNNLGVTLHYLRRALGRAEWIIFEQEHYAFNHGLIYTFDLEAFESSLAAARRLQSGQAESPLAEAVNLYQGDFCSDLAGGEWLGSRREELRRLYLEALLRLGGLQFAGGRYAEAAETYQTAIAADSYLEQAHRELMRCYARQGERGQALRHYQALHQLLVDQVGAPPASETAALYERLKRGQDV